MAKFRRKGPHCLAPEVTGKAHVIKTGEVVTAPLSTGWADDPDWEWVDRPAAEPQKEEP